MDIAVKIHLAKKYAKIFLNEKMSSGDILTLAAEIQFFTDSLVKDKIFMDKFLINPSYPDSLKLDLMNEFIVKGGFSGYTKELIFILIRKKRMEILPYVAKELHKVADIILSRLRIQMTTAFEPSHIEIKDISKEIGRFFGKNVFVERHVDPSLIGGFVLEGDGKLVDLSVFGQLKRNLLGKI